MKYCLLFLFLSGEPLFAQSSSFWNTYPSKIQSRQSQSASIPSSDECEWREREATITILGNDELWLNADIISYTCDSEGNPNSSGDYVHVENKGKASFYYRSSPPDTYINPNTKTFQRGTSSNAYYFELAPNETRIVDVVDYRNQKEKYLPTHAVLNVKYCKPRNYPTQNGIASLNQFKVKQQKFNTANSSQLVGNKSGAISCSHYYLAIVVADYYHQDNTSTERVPGYLHIISSDVFKSSENLETEGHKTIYNDNIMYVKHVALPQCPTSDFDPFSSQNLIRDVSIPKVFQRADLTCHNSGGGQFSFGALHLFKGDTKEELEKIKRRFSDLNSYKENIRESYTGFNGYKFDLNNSIFTFNQDVVCLEN